MPRGCLESVKVSGLCLDGDWMVSGQYLEVLER